MSNNKPPFMGELTSLSSLCSKGKSSLRQKDLNDAGSYPVYGASGIVGYLEVYQNDREYIAVVKDGAGVGRTIKCKGKSSVLGTMQALLPREGVECDYLLHLVRALNLGSSFNGSTIPHIYFKDYGKLPVPSFSPEQQRDISRRFEEVESLIDLENRTLECLNHLIKSQFVEMFGSSSFPEVQMGRLINAITAGTNVGGQQRPLGEDEYAVLKISAVTKGVFLPDEYKVVSDVSSIKMIHPRKGDLLFSRANTSEMVGSTAIVDRDYDNLFLPDKLWRLDPAEDVDTVFLKELLSTRQVRREMSKVATGSSGSMQNISMAKFKKLSAFLPPYDLQQQFATFVAKVDKSRFVARKSTELIIKNT